MLLMAWLRTNYGRMMASYFPNYFLTHLDTFESSLKKKSFLLKKQLNDGNHGQGIHSANVRTDNLVKNTLNTPKFIRLTCPIDPKVWDNIEKKGFIGRP